MPNHPNSVADTYKIGEVFFSDDNVKKISEIYEQGKKEGNCNSEHSFWEALCDADPDIKEEEPSQDIGKQLAYLSDCIEKWCQKKDENYFPFRGKEIYEGLDFADYIAMHWPDQSNTSNQEAPDAEVLKTHLKSSIFHTNMENISGEMLLNAICHKNTAAFKKTAYKILRQFFDDDNLMKPEWNFGDNRTIRNWLDGSSRPSLDFDATFDKPTAHLCRIINLCSALNSKHGCFDKRLINTPYHLDLSQLMLRLGLYTDCYIYTRNLKHLAIYASIINCKSGTDAFQLQNKLINARLEVQNRVKDTRQSTDAVISSLGNLISLINELGKKTEHASSPNDWDNEVKQTVQEVISQTKKIVADLSHLSTLTKEAREFLQQVGSHAFGVINALELTTNRAFEHSCAMKEISFTEETMSKELLLCTRARAENAKNDINAAYPQDPNRRQNTPEISKSIDDFLDKESWEEDLLSFVRTWTTDFEISASQNTPSYYQSLSQKMYMECEELLRRIEERYADGIQELNSKKSIDRLKSIQSKNQLTKAILGEEENEEANGLIAAAERVCPSDGAYMLNFQRSQYIIAYLENKLSKVPICNQSSVRANLNEELLNIGVRPLYNQINDYTHLLFDWYASRFIDLNFKK